MKFRHIIGCLPVPGVLSGAILLNRISDITGDMPLDPMQRRQLREGFINTLTPTVVMPARFERVGWKWEGFLRGVSGLYRVLSVPDPITVPVLREIICMNMRGEIDAVLRITDRFTLFVPLGNPLSMRRHGRAGQIGSWFECPRDTCTCLGGSSGVASDLLL
jgi:hypothetical protein